MSNLTEDQRQRLTYLVERSYRREKVTTGGIVMDKTARELERHKCEARAVVDFVVDHVTDQYLAPEGLWSELFGALLDAGTLVRLPNGAVQHRYDRRDNQ